MTPTEYRETEDFSPNTWVNRLFEKPVDYTYQLMIYAFMFASLSHLWLADAWTGDWLISNIIFVFGLVFLVARSSLIGWILTAIAAAIPLLFHRDVLTQSALLFMISSSGIVYQSLCIFKADDRMKYEKAHLSTVGWLGMITYCFAFLHKLNRDFLNPEFSCAVYGFDKLESYYSFTLDGVDPFLAYCVLACEISIPLLYFFGKKYAARTLALFFHVPLTLTMAPAFVFVMAISHLAFFDAAERRAYKAVFSQYWRTLLLLSLLTILLSLYLHGTLPEWTMIPREFMLWLGLFWTLLTWKKNKSRSPNLEKVRPSIIALFLFTLNCLTPYLGVQYQHTAAMLSNLRIDKGCWNSSVFPESIRLVDDYVRVQKTHFVEPGRIEEYEKIVLEQLWSPPQIRQMRRNWCSSSIRPFRMEGTYKNRSFVISDVCDEDEDWPFEEDGVLGFSIFDDALRFQKNLKKECPQACLH